MKTDEIKAWNWLLANVMHSAFEVDAKNLNIDFIDQFFADNFGIEAVTMTDERNGMMVIISPMDERLEDFRMPKWCPLVIHPHARPQEHIFAQGARDIDLALGVGYAYYLMTECGLEIKSTNFKDLRDEMVEYFKEYKTNKFQHHKK